MQRIGIKFLVIIGTVYALVDIFEVGMIEETTSLMVFAVLLLLINMTIKPLLLLISIPITFLTLGLFSLLINTWMVTLADRMVKGVEIYGFWNTLLLAVCFSLLNTILIHKTKLVKD